MLRTITEGSTKIGPVTDPAVPDAHQVSKVIADYFSEINGLGIIDEDLISITRPDTA